MARIGIAQAMAIEEQVRAYGGPQFQVTQQVLNRFAEAIQQSGVDVVPRVVVGGGGKDGSARTGSIMEGLLTMLLSEKMGTVLASQANAPRSPEAEALRDADPAEHAEDRPVPGRGGARREMLPREKLPNLNQKNQPRIARMDMKVGGKR